MNRGPVYPWGLAAARRPSPPGLTMDSLNRHEQLLRLFALIDILFGARQPLTTEEIKARLRERG